MVSEETIHFYNQNASDLSVLYQAVDFNELNEDWLCELGDSKKVLDLGAGIGREALGLAEMGLDVVSVEPSIEFFNIGKDKTSSFDNVVWFNGTIQGIRDIPYFRSGNNKFDFIILNAVWMHIPPEDRTATFNMISNLLNPGGKVMITLRHGKNNDSRDMHRVSVDELKYLSFLYNLKVYKVIEKEDKLNRSDVSWETVLISK